LRSRPVRASQGRILRSRHQHGPPLPPGHYPVLGVLAVTGQLLCCSYSARG